MSGVRRAAAVVFVGCLLALTGTPSPAHAHPLGNFTINHHVGVHVAQGRVSVTYVVDMAEIPAFGVLRSIGAPADADALRSYSSNACMTLADGLKLTLDGVPLALGVVTATAAAPPGNAGVPTLRVECGYESPAGGGELIVEDTNHAERIGWREMVATSDGVPISTDLPSESPTSVLTSYPEDGLLSVPDVRTATIVIGAGGVAVPTSVQPAVTALGDLVDVESIGLGTGLVALGAAMALGTGHALAPGHGKTVVAAYLVGSNGTPRQAVLLALATAFSHTVGVAVLGVIAATASVTFEPAALYPYLSSLAGLVVLGIGVRLSWRVVRDRRHDDHHHHGHDHGHGHDDPHHAGDHDHHSRAGTSLGWKSVAALGLSGGLVPSASAVVLLLGAVHLGNPWFGVVLVVAFGLGMSVALVGSGLLAVLARRWGWRLLGRNRSRRRLWRWVTPAAAAGVVILGTVMTVTALAGISTLG